MSSVSSLDGLSEFDSDDLASDAYDGDEPGRTPLLSGQRGGSPALVHPMLGAVARQGGSVATRPPLAPGDRLQHLKIHMRQLKRLYRQEQHQEELARRDTLLQMLCTSSITLFRHCASRDRFFTAVRALLRQYVPARDAKLFQVECGGDREYLVAHSEDDGVVLLGEEQLSARWGGLGIAGRSAAAAELIPQTLRGDGVVSGSSEGIGAVCVVEWLQELSTCVVISPNKHLIFQLPAQKLLHAGFRPGFDLAMSEGRPPLSGLPQSDDEEPNLLVMALIGSHGKVVGVIEALVDPDTTGANTALEFLDAFGVLVASALESRRRICRSRMEKLYISIPRDGERGTPRDHHAPVLRVRLEDRTRAGRGEIVAFGGGAVLEDLDVAVLEAMREPLVSLLDTSDDQQRELRLHSAIHRNLVVLSQELWRLMADDPSMHRHNLRLCVNAFFTSVIDCWSNDCSPNKPQTRVRLLFEGETIDAFRNAYSIAPFDDDKTFTLQSSEQDFAILEQVMTSDGWLSSSDNCVAAVLPLVDVMTSSNEVAELASSCIGLLVSIEPHDDNQEMLVRITTETMLPLLSIGVQAIAAASTRLLRIFGLENDLACVVAEREQRQREAQMLTDLVERAGEWFASPTIQDFVRSVNATRLPNEISGMKLIVVEPSCDLGEDGDVTPGRVWTIIDDVETVLMDGVSGSLSPALDVLLPLQRRECLSTNRSFLGNVRRPSEGKSLDDFRGEGRYYVIPLFTSLSRTLPSGIAEFSFTSQTNRETFTNSSALRMPLLQLLSAALATYVQHQQLQNRCRVEIAATTTECIEAWMKLHAFAARLSQLPVDDNISLDAWSREISIASHELLPAAYTVNVLLCFGDMDRDGALAAVLADPDRVKDRVLRELGLFNNQDLREFECYPLLMSSTRGQERLGFFIVSKATDNYFTDAELRLMQLMGQIIAAHATTLSARVHSWESIEQLSNVVEKKSVAIDQLYSTTMKLSTRSQQLLLLQRIASTSVDERTFMTAESIEQWMKMTLDKGMSVLRSIESLELLGGVVISPDEACSVIAPVMGKSECQVQALVKTEFEDGGELNWLSDKHATQHHRPFASLPQPVQRRTGVNLHGNSPDVINLLPLRIADDSEHSAWLLVSTFSNKDGNRNNLMDEEFIAELSAAFASLLQAHTHAATLDARASVLAAQLSSLERGHLKLQQEHRLHELTSIVWMKVIGESCKRDSPSKLNEPTLLSFFRNAVFRRIVPFLREEISIVRVELAVDSASMERFIDTLSSDVANIVRRSDGIVLLDPAYCSRTNWIAQKWTHPHTAACFGMFYIEWESVSASSDAPNDPSKLKDTLLWLSDWLQSLARYCADHCFVLDQTALKSTRIAELEVEAGAKTDRIAAQDQLMSLWSVLSKVAIQLWSNPSVDGTSLFLWRHIFSLLPLLECGNEVVVWACDDQRPDCAWTLRADGSEQSRSWLEMTHALHAGNSRLRPIPRLSSSPNCHYHGVVEFTEVCEARFRSADEAQHYCGVLARAISAFFHLNHLQDSITDVRKEAQAAINTTQKISNHWEARSAHAAFVAQHIEEFVLQRKIGEQTDARSFVSQFFEHTERTVATDSSRTKHGNDVVGMRFLLQCVARGEADVISSCSRDCDCQKPLSIESTIKKLRSLQLDRINIGGIHTSIFPLSSTKMEASNKQLWPATLKSLFLPECRRHEVSKLEAMCDLLRPACHDSSGGQDPLQWVVIEVKRDEEDVGLTMIVLSRGDGSSALVESLRVLAARVMNAVSRILREGELVSQLFDVQAQSVSVSESAARTEALSSRLAAASTAGADAIARALDGDELGLESVTGAVRDVARLLFGRGVDVQLCLDKFVTSKDGTFVNSVAQTMNQTNNNVNKHDTTSDARTDAAEFGIKSGDSDIETFDCELRRTPHGRLGVLSLTFDRLTYPMLEKDQHAMDMVVRVAECLVIAKNSKAASQAQRSRCNDEMSALQIKHSALEVNCLEIKSALERSETLRGSLRTFVKKSLEPMAVHIVGWMSKATSCKSLDILLQLLGDALSGITGVSGVRICEPRKDAHSNATIHFNSVASSSDTAVFDTKRINDVIGRCATNRESQVILIKPAGNVSSSNSDSMGFRRWLTVEPFEADLERVMVVLVLVGQANEIERNMGKDPYQVGHIRLLCRVADLQGKRLVGDAIVTEQSASLESQEIRYSEKVSQTRSDLEELKGQVQLYRNLTCTFADDALRALAWTDKTWRQSKLSRRELASAWQELTRLIRDRIASIWRTAAPMEVSLYGAVQSHRMAFYLPPHARGKFSFVTFTSLSERAATRRLWSVFVTGGEDADATNNERTRELQENILPIVDTRQNDNTVVRSVVAVVVVRCIPDPAIADSSILRDIVTAAAPFVRGVMTAVGGKYTAARQEDNYSSRVFVPQTDFQDPPRRIYKRHERRADEPPTNNLNAESLQRRRHEYPHVDSIHGSAAGQLGRSTSDERIDTEGDDLSSASSRSQAQSDVALKMLELVLEVQRTADVDSLQRVVMDRLGSVWRRHEKHASDVVCEAVVLQEGDNQLDGGLSAVKSVLLPTPALKQVVARIKESARAPNKVWKVKSTSSDSEYWVIALESCTSTDRQDEAKAVVGFLAICGSRLQNILSSEDEHFLIPHIAHIIEEQLVHFQRSGQLKSQITTLKSQHANCNEVAVRCNQLEVLQREFEALTRIIRVSNQARSELYLVQLMRQHLRDYLQCRHVEYESAVKLGTGDNNIDLDINGETKDGARYNPGHESKPDHDEREDEARSTALELRHAVKLRVFSGSGTESQRLLGTFHAQFRAGAAGPSEEQQRHLKIVACMVEAAFQRLGALKQLDHERTAGATAITNMESLIAENARLLDSQRELELKLDAWQTRQAQFADIERVNSSLQTEMKQLREQLKESEAKHAERSAEIAQVRESLLQSTAEVKQAEKAEVYAMRLQTENDELRARERAMEKKAIKRRMKMQQLVDEIARLKRVEEFDKFRMTELEKHAALSQHSQIQERQTKGAPEAISCARHVSEERKKHRAPPAQQLQHQTQKRKQLRLAEELRCLAALEVRELKVRQVEQRRHITARRTQAHRRAVVVPRRSETHADVTMSATQMSGPVEKPIYYD